MSCEVRGDLIICRADCIAIIRRIVKCPKCKTRRRFTGIDEAWYGVRWTCNHCGFMSQDGHAFRSGKKDLAKQAERAREAWKTPFDNSAAYWADYFDKS